MATTRAVLNVPDVSCNHCKMAIEGALDKLAGIEEATVDVPEKTVTVAFDDDQVALETIEGAIGEEGYAVAGRHVFGT